jgi:hypothetical protein
VKLGLGVVVDGMVFFFVIFSQRNGWLCECAALRVRERGVSLQLLNLS